MPAHPRRVLSILLLGLFIPAACVGVSTGAGATTDPTVLASPTAMASPIGDSATETTTADRTTTTHADSADMQWDVASEIAIELADGGSTAGDGVSVAGDVVTVTAAGTYRIGGTLTDGQLAVDVAGDGVVRLILDGVAIASSTTAPLFVVDADEVVVILAEGSTNALSDATTYLYPSADVDEPNAALFSTADLTIAGDGSLTVTGNANDAIASKDGLVIVGGTITVDAVDDGIRGKDYLVVTDGDIAVTAGGDALKSENEEDASLGYVAISGGTLDLTAGTDGVEAVTAFRMDGGSLTIAATDDGIHSEALLAVAGGTIDITGSYEGLEGTEVVITAGDIAVVAEDDGLNVAGGDATEPTGAEPGGGGGPGGGGEQAVEGWFLEMSGGTLVMTTGRDGIDSNGSASITGGTLVVHGPTRGGGDGAIDVNGTLEISGGVVVGAGGLAMGPRMSAGSSANTSQPTLAFSFETAQPAGTVVQVRTTDGEVILTFTPVKAVGALVLSSPDLVAGTTYEVLLGGTSSGETVGGLALDAPASGGTSAGTVVAS